MLDYTPETVGVRYQVDGVWHDRAALERESGDAILEVFKRLAALKVENRRARQSGSFGVEVGKEKFGSKIVSQGTQTGERVLLQLEQTKLSFKSPDDIGMRTKTQEKLTELKRAERPADFLRLAPAGSWSTTIDVVLTNTDRFIRNYVAVIDAAKNEREIENVQVTTFSSAEGETPATASCCSLRARQDPTCALSARRGRPGNADHSLRAKGEQAAGDH